MKAIIYNIINIQVTSFMGSVLRYDIISSISSLLANIQSCGLKSLLMFNNTRTARNAIL